MEEQKQGLELIKILEALDHYIEKKVALKSNLKPLDSYESESTNEIHTALSKAQGEFPPIGYNRENPYFKNKYADFDSIVRTIRPLLSKHGLSVTQQTVINAQGIVILKTKLRHMSGQWIETQTRITPTKTDMQSYGSTLSYMKRYSYMALLNITTTDEGEFEEIELNHFAKTVGGKSAYQIITSEQLEELQYELDGYKDITEKILQAYNITKLADMPKEKYLASIKRIKEIKQASKTI